MTNFIFKEKVDGVEVIHFANSDLYDEYVENIGDNELASPDLPEDVPYRYLKISGDAVVINEDETYHNYVIETELEKLYQEKKEAALSSVIDIELSVGTFSFNFDAESRQDFRDTREATKITDANEHWKDLNNNILSLTPQDFDLVFLELRSAGKTVWDAYQLDKAEVIDNSDYSFTNLNNL